MFKHHDGAVTGDEFARVMAYCAMHDSRKDDDSFRSMAPLDAPDWVNTGRMVKVDDVQFQAHTLRTNLN